MDAVTLVDQIHQLLMDFINFLLREFQTVFFRVVHRIQLNESHTENKKLSWCWQTLATRLEVNQGHQTVAFHMLGIVFSCAIVTLSLRRTVLGYSTSKHVVTLKSGSEVTQGHWELVPFGIVYGLLLVFFGNFVPKTHRFLDIRLPKCRDLEKRITGPSRSL